MGLLETRSTRRLPDAPCLRPRRRAEARRWGVECLQSARPGCRHSWAS